MLSAARLSAADNSLDELHEEKLATAKDLYQAVEVAYDAGALQLSDVYAASKSWKDSAYELAKTKAERVAALQQHFDRMAKWHARIHALALADAKGGEANNDAATQFWQIQAECWLLEERAKP